MSKPTEKRITCECGRTFYTSDDVKACQDCLEYDQVSIGGMLPRHESWSPPRNTFDKPRQSPWKDDRTEGGLL